MDFSAHLYQGRYYLEAQRAIARAEGCTCDPVTIHDQDRNGADLIHRADCHWPGHERLAWWIAYN
jgi:hypothetical protein